MSHSLMFISGFAIAFFLIIGGAQLSAESAKRVCMEITGAQSCEMEWVAQ